MSNTEAGNKLIAEFMGRPYKFPRLNFTDGNVSEVVILPHYEMSWDELMLVVEKISNTVYINGDYSISELSEMRDMVCRCNLNSSIENIWHRIIQFIQWYNTNSKPGEAGIV